jgi:hypothetical protein
MTTVKMMIQQVNSFSFWKVLFGWGKFKNWMIECLLDLQQVLDNAEHQQTQLTELQRDLDQAGIMIEANENRISELQRDREIALLQVNELRNKVQQAEIRLSEERSKSERRDEEQIKLIQSVQELKAGVQEEARRKQESEEQALLLRQEQQRVIWQTHQEMVKNKIRLICDKHIITYEENPPFTGRPDNTIRICNEYIVFDAKSPVKGNLKSFAEYLKSEAKDAEKYAKQENVSTDVFFVVPFNTLEVLSQTTMQYTYGTHRVFIVPAEAVEIIILRLKKIEEYEFADKLSPEDRENTCRLIARLLYYIKRQLQLDNYMAKEAIGLAGDCDTLLPDEFRDLVEKTQLSLTMNPPQARSGKDINLADLQKQTLHVQRWLEGLSVSSLNGFFSMENVTTLPINGQQDRVN